MANQYTRKFVKARFDTFCKAMGLSQECWAQDAEGRHNKANIESVYLDHEPVYGGYNINVINSEGGGVRQLNGYCNRLNGKELVAFMDGAQWAAEHAAKNKAEA